MNRSCRTADGSFAVTTFTANRAIGKLSRCCRGRVPTVLVLSDIHVDPLCPMSDPWMRYVVSAARARWNVTATIVLGDLMSSGGGDNGLLVWDFAWRLQYSRVRPVIILIGYIHFDSSASVCVKTFAWKTRYF